MKLTIVGAGTIGGVTGAYLVKAGHDVTFVDIVDEHIQALNARCLTVEDIRGQSTVPARAIHFRTPGRPARAEMGAVGPVLGPRMSPCAKLGLQQGEAGSGIFGLPELCDRRRVCHGDHPQDPELDARGSLEAPRTRSTHGSGSV